MGLWDRILGRLRKQPAKPAAAPPPRARTPVPEPVSGPARLRFQGPEHFREAYRQGRLTYEFFVNAVQQAPGLLWDLTAGERAGEVTFARWQKLGEPLRRTLQEFVGRLALERLQGAEDRWPILLDVAAFSGTEVLLRCCEIIEKRGWPGLGRPPEPGRQASEAPPKQVIAHILSSVSVPAEQVESAQTARDFSTRTRLIVAALAARMTPALERALGWPGLAQAVEIARRLQEQGPTVRPLDAETRSAARTAMETLGAERARPLLATLRAHGFDSAVLLEAVMDWNCPALERSLAKGSPLAAAAYGALPESNDPLRRYLLLKQVVEGAGAYAGRRGERLRRAAEVGMENLAVVCGCEDRTRLTWAMEAQLSAAKEAELPLPHLPAEEEIGPCRARLDLRAGQPQIEVAVGEQVLDHPPPELEATPQMRRLRREQARWEEEAARLPGTLEEMMVRARPLRELEMAYLCASPVAREILARVVMICGDQTGVCAHSGKALTDLEGNHWETAGEIRVAHPYDLWRLRQLDAWRDWLVENGVTQPFAQTFRELYSLTLAERQLVTASARFEGTEVEEGPFVQALSQGGWARASAERFIRPAQPGLQVCAGLRREPEAPARTVVGRVWFEDARGTRQSLERLSPVLVSEALGEVAAAVLASAKSPPSAALEPIAAARAAYLSRLCARAGAAVRVAECKLEVRGAGGVETLDLLVRSAPAAEEKRTAGLELHLPHPDQALASLTVRLREILSGN